jgi:hypothetical protein
MSLDVAIATTPQTGLDMRESTRRHRAEALAANATECSA